MSEKTESLAEYLARGGRIHRVQREDIKPRRYAYTRTRSNIPLEDRAAFVADRAKLKKAVGNG